MSGIDVDQAKARNLTVGIMQIALNTAVHQRESKVVEYIIHQAPDTSTLAVATASIQRNSEVTFEETEQLRRIMKILLDTQMLGDSLEGQEKLASLMKMQIDTQIKLSDASDKQAKAAIHLGRINIFLAVVASVLAAVQVLGALR